MRSSVVIHLLGYRGRTILFWEKWGEGLGSLDRAENLVNLFAFKIPNLALGEVRTNKKRAKSLDFALFYSGGARGIRTLFDGFGDRC